MVWYQSWEFWVGLGIAFAIWMLSYVLRIYFMKGLYWYQNWALGFNMEAYRFGNNLRKKYDGKFSDGRKNVGTEMLPLRKRKASEAKHKKET